MTLAAELYRNYLSPNDQRLSLSQEIMLIRDGELDKMDVRDRGIHRSNPTKPRFTLAVDRYEETTRLARELQQLLQNMNAEVPNSKGCYEIDPCNRLIPLLAGAHSLEHLTISYKILIERIKTGSRYVEKYYEMSKGERVPESPISTDVGFYDAAYEQSSPNTMLRLQMSLPKSAYRSMTIDPSKSSRSLAELAPVNEDLAVAFGHRDPEDRPNVITYNRSTGLQGPLWKPPLSPEVVIDPAPTVKGKSRAVAFDTAQATPSITIQPPSLTNTMSSKKSLTNPADPKLTVATYDLNTFKTPSEMMHTTPWKSQQEFFSTRVSRASISTVPPSLAPPLVPPSSNVLFGLASANSSARISSFPGRKGLNPSSLPEEYSTGPHRGPLGYPSDRFSLRNESISGHTRRESSNPPAGLLSGPPGGFSYAHTGNEGNGGPPNQGPPGGDEPPEDDPNVGMPAPFGPRNLYTRGSLDLFESQRSK
ncbi:hypothetical protein BJ138DRAFT_1118248 [Hygrophoropsis aurantiaca]|uniref:Uncharacterized protein n=1 Tax=Hygrophoropsis aurantiaca TaxID=72124 RepID=A0ACB7ZY95_9AGAM|nr:hypothetical protein BJ138DRAFT_1118248 [Hygrophoropsis aurantiaca]